MRAHTPFANDDLGVRLIEAHLSRLIIVNDYDLGLGLLLEYRATLERRQLAEEVLILQTDREEKEVG